MRRWYAINKHGVTLQGSTSSPTKLFRVVSKVCKGEIRKHDQEVNLYFERDENESYCNSERNLSKVYRDDFHRR